MLKESQIQAFYVGWLQAEHKAGNLLCYRIANEQKTGSLLVILKDAQMGNLKGMPDLGIILPNGKQFFVEFKRRKEKPSREQVEVHATLNAFNTPVIVVDNVSKVDGDKIINKITELGGLVQFTQEYLNDEKIDSIFKKATK